MTKTPSRKLAVILHADVVGSTKLVQMDESIAHERIRTAFQRLSKTIESYGGIAHEIRGDALVAEFSRASDAVCAAVAFQAEISEHNQTLSDDIRPEIRVGVSMGEVVVADGTITGAGVVLAQRLEQIAEPGGVCIQAAAYETVPKRFPFAYESLGERTLKGFDEPVRAHWVSLTAGEVVPSPEFTESEKPFLELPDKPSIAVLPFTNMSGDLDQEYLSDGIAEDLITNLCRFRWLSVVSRSSTFAYKGRSPNIKQLGQHLGARYVVEGSVRKDGARMRVTIQLIDAVKDSHVWAERFDRELSDLFAIQVEIAESIAAAIEPEIGDAERERARRRPPESLDAWESYQRGLWHMYRFDESDLAEAGRLFQRAIVLDVAFSAAYAAAAYVRIHQVFYGFTEDPEESLNVAADEAHKAVALDDKDPVAHFTLGRVCSMRCEYDTAIFELERAIELNSSFAQAYHGLGFTLSNSGRMEEALPYFEKALNLSPHDPHVWSFMSQLAYAYLQLKQYDDARIWATKATRHSNSQIWAHAYLTSALAHLDRIDEAAVVLGELLARHPDFSLSFARKYMVYVKDPDHINHCLDGLRRAGLRE